MGREILKRPSDGEVFDIAQVFLEGWDDIQGRFKVTSPGDSSYSNYESGNVSPGADSDGYDVKNTGGFFATVTTAYNIQIKNTNEISEITIYLNTDGSNPITISENSQFNIEGFPVTNIFIDTPAGYDSNVEVLLFG